VVEVITVTTVLVGPGFLLEGHTTSVVVLFPLRRNPSLGSHLPVSFDCWGRSAEALSAVARQVMVNVLQVDVPVNIIHQRRFRF
jgi:hypothetical protein